MRRAVLALVTPSTWMARKTSLLSSHLREETAGGGRQVRSRHFLFVPVSASSFSLRSHLPLFISSSPSRCTVNKPVTRWLHRCVSEPTYSWKELTSQEVSCGAAAAAAGGSCCRGCSSGESPSLK